jgi:hypothetical protein
MAYISENNNMHSQRSYFYRLKVIDRPAEELMMVCENFIINIREF